MQPENFNKDAEQANQVTQASPLHQATPLSKYLAMTLFIVLPFVGGYIGYQYAPEKVVEVEKEMVREMEVERVEEVPVVTEASEVMFTVTNVELNPSVSLGEPVTVTWDFEPGTNPNNAYLRFQIESSNGVIISNGLKGAGSPGLYKQGRADIAIPTLCSEVPSEGCIDDSEFVEDATYVLKVTGQSCADGETIPGYCEFSDTELLETKAFYSNEFTLR